MKDLIPVFDKLQKRKEQIEKELKAIQDSIDGLQQLCEHEFYPDGYDSHHDWEKCSICGKRERC